MNVVGGKGRSLIRWRCRATGDELVLLVHTESVRREMVFWDV
jgi:hypothetical protein